VLTEDALTVFCQVDFVSVPADPQRILLFETAANKTSGSFGDALWKAIVTATTAGYGDVSPVTVEGRVIAVVLMLTGIGVKSPCAPSVQLRYGRAP
jgi:voltage-gated potassium channel